MSGKPKSGYPKYHRGDKVAIKFKDHQGEIVEKMGTIEIVDAFGTFFQKDEPSYDVMVVEENCLYKHVNESCVVELIEAAEDPEAKAFNERLKKAMEEMPDFPEWMKEDIKY